jgi:hypothetical protein
VIAGSRLLRGGEGFARRLSGRYEVYVQPFPGPGGKYQISNWFEELKRVAPPGIK